MDDAHKELVKRLRVHFRSVNASGAPCMTPRNPDGEEAALALEVLAGEVEKWKQDAAWDKAAASDFLGRAEAAEAERDRLKAALEKFIAEANNAPKRFIGSGIGGQTMEATLQRAGRLVSEWQLGQLEEALGDAS